MNRVLKGLSYTFKRNLGRQDRLIRAALGVLLCAPYLLKLATATAGIALGIAGLMIIGTALVARCSLCYMAGVCTIGTKEKEMLAQRGIQSEP
jgi:hypothetical protein